MILEERCIMCGSLQRPSNKGVCLQEMEVK